MRCLQNLEQNVDSFEAMCDTYRARRQARDRGNLSIDSRDIKGLSTGPLFPLLRKKPRRQTRIGTTYGKEAGNESPLSGVYIDIAEIKVVVIGD